MHAIATLAPDASLQIVCPFSYTAHKARARRVVWTDGLAMKTRYRSFQLSFGLEVDECAIRTCNQENG